MEVHRNNNEYVKKNLNLLILTPGNENYCNFFSTSLEKCLTKMIHFNDVLQKCLTIMIHFESVFLLRNTDFLRNKDMDKWILKCRNICHRAFIDKKNAWCSFTETTASYCSINSGSNPSKSNCILSGAKPKGPTACRRENKT